MSLIRTLLILATLLTICSLTARPEPPAADKKPRVDLYGDPLPEGAVARLGTKRFRPGGSVQSVDVSSDGKTIISAAWGPTIDFWDIDTGKKLRALGNSDRFDLAIISPNGKIVASNSGGLVELWDVSSGKR